MKIGKVSLKGRETDYFLKRGNRRTVGLRIDAKGLTVHIPARMPEYGVESLLLQKADWILKKMEEAKSRTRPSPKWEEGEEVPFLGKSRALRISPSGRARVALNGEFLEVALPDSSPEKVEAAVRNWYRKQALEYFAHRVDHYCPRLGVQMPRLFLSNAKTRWGSCNSKGEVRLNWRLILMPPHLVDYVVAHELSHLLEMNHSEAFWKAVGSVYPEYRSARAELRRFPSVVT